MPPLKGPAYLIGYLFEIGPVMESGLGPVAITYGEIDSWCRLTGIRLTPSEARLLRRLSAEFLRESRKRSEVSPWRIEVSEEQLRAVASDLRSMVSRLAS